MQAAQTRSPAEARRLVGTTSSLRHGGWLRRGWGNAWTSGPLVPTSGQLAGFARQPPSLLQLNPDLRLHADVERVLDLLHLRHQVGKVDELGAGVAAGDDNVLVGPPGA